MGATPEKTIGISRVISWHIPASIKRGVKYKVVGEIQPRISGVKVYLDDGSTQVSGVTTDGGKFEIEFSATKIGFRQFKIVTDSESSFIGSTSLATSVLVR